MALKAFPHYLWDPSYVTAELRSAEDKFCESWLNYHSIPDELQLFHYTTLQGMQGILRDRSLWLSHVTSFNDPHEIEYGKKLIIEVLNDFVRREDSPVIRDFLSGILPFVQSFGKQMHHAFVVCFCESGNLLSQWRGYADQGCGYSLGFKFSEATQIASSLDNPTGEKIPGPFFRKVIYCPEQQKKLIESYLQGAVDAVRDLIGRIRKNRPDCAIMGVQASNLILDMLLCFKHPAFAEEKEWRLFRVTRGDHEPETIRFKDTARLLVPYRPTYLFDVVENSMTKFPLRTVYSGPALEPTRASAALELFLHNAASNASPIKLVRSDVQILNPGFELR